MGAEKNIVQRLNETLQYTKQKIAMKLSELNSKSSIDISQKDLSVIMQSMNLVLDQVYRDMARGFSQIKEDVVKEREATKHEFETKLVEEMRKAVASPSPAQRS